MIPLRAGCLVGVMLLAPMGARAAIQARLLAEGFEEPVFAASPAGDPRLFVVEKVGRIRIVDLGTKRAGSTPFLTIPDVRNSGEQGLLGLAFHPDFARNGEFFVNLTRAPDGATEIRRYRVSASDPHRANPNPTVLLRIAQPYANHNGGWMGFGPDGFLYVATGDGGSGNDPENRAQNPASLLGKILRLDVDRPAGGRAYGIPADNPFADGRAGAPEVWHRGLRNPWRCSFDRETGDLWIADVGQGAREEINFRPAALAGGANFGWRPLEGDIRTAGVDDPVPPDAVAPLHVYPRSLGRSVTGGYVFRGPDAADARGLYVFADFASSRVWTLRREGSGPPDVREITAGLTANGGVPSPSSFAEDAAGRLYLLSFSGRIFRLATGLSPRPVVEVNGNRRKVVGAPRIRLAGRARAEEPLRRVIYRRAGSSRVVAARGRQSWRVTVPLRVGKNLLRFQAEDAEGSRSRIVPITVIRRQ